MKWRVINEGSFSEPMHQALEQVLTERLDRGGMRPTLRFWYRDSPSVPLGRFQAFRDEVEEDYVEEKGIDVVRRITGGGAMFCEPGNVITYSIYIPGEEVSENVEKSYSQLDGFAVDALKGLDVDASYKPLNDIEHPDGKLGGAAQLRKKNAVLHHTTMSYNLDTEEMLRVLRIGKEKISDKAIESAEKRVARISDYVEDSRENVVEALIDEFSKGREVENGSLTGEEVEEAERLVEEKFGTEEWNRKM